MAKLVVNIIVINYNGLDNTLDCLESLRKLVKGQYSIDVLVVENGSTDGSTQALSRLRDIHLLISPRNLGFAGGANLGIREAIRRYADYVLILNNDTVVHPHLVKNLIVSRKYADIISPKIYFAPGFEFHKSRYKKADLGRVIWYAGGTIDWKNIIGVHFGVDQVDHGQFNRRLSIDLATGAAMFASRQVFDRIGLFDEKYFLYLEDMDFCTRAKRAGAKIFFEPSAILWHKNASSTGGSGSNIQDYYISRNRLLFAAKYASARTKLAVFRQIVAQINVPEKRKALFDFLTFRFGKGGINAG